MLNIHANLIKSVAVKQEQVGDVAVKKQLSNVYLLYTFVTLLLLFFNLLKAKV